MRRHRVNLLLAVPLSLVLAVSGCTGAASGSAPPPAGGRGRADGLTYHERLVRYTQCMRDNGVKMNDPVLDANGDGGVTIQDDADADPAKRRAAAAKCDPLLGGGDGKSEQVDPANVETLRKWAKCLRENGLSDYPDPGSDGSIAQKALDPNDPTVSAAVAACDKMRSNPDGGK
jgi:hypothetical protein